MINVGSQRSIRFNVSRFRCHAEGQHHTLQEQTSFREIWIPISHAKHCNQMVMMVIDVLMNPAAPVAAVAKA
jgi:hypothetical protein